jgi:5-methyltetrahydropteroyltriglutamate--homocysteine methyltransferase
MRQAADGRWEVYDALDVPAAPMTLSDYLFAREQAEGHAEVKGIVTGPITLALACRVVESAPYIGPEDPALILRLAEILGREVAALVASGAAVVQVDEPALSTTVGARITPELAYDALRDLAALPRVPMLHVCGDIRAKAEELLLLPFRVLSIENTSIPNLDALDAEQAEFAETRLCVGCVSSQGEASDPVEVIRARVEAAQWAGEPTQLWIAPDCGLRQLTPEQARERLTRLVAAVQDVRAAL